MFSFMRNVVADPNNIPLLTKSSQLIRTNTITDITIFLVTVIVVNALVRKQSATAWYPHI